MTRQKFQGVPMVAVIAGLLAVASASAPGQGRGPGGGGNPGGGGAMGGQGGMGGPGGGRGPGGNQFLSPHTATSNRNSGSMRGGLQLGPPGRWWDDKAFASSLGLRSDQQRKMDVVFNSNKGLILQRYEALQQEEARMAQLTSDTHLQEGAIFAQVDRVSQARAALEKATAHLVLLLRLEMDADQISRLEQKQAATGGQD